MSLESAKTIANDLANKGVYPDITDAHYEAYDKQLVAIQCHLSDIRKLVGAAHDIAL